MSNRSVDYSLVLPLVVLASGEEADSKHFAETGWPRFPSGAASLNIIHEAAVSVVETDTSREVLSQVSNPYVTKMVTVNPVTEEVVAYRLEKHTILVNWSKAIPVLCKATLAVGSFTAGWLGFIGIGVFLFDFIRESGVKLTHAEAAVFAAVYHHRNENLVLPEAQLLPKVSLVADESGVHAPSQDRVFEALENLKKLGIISISEGDIILEDEWVVCGKWR